jgi:hypothetical protein
VNFVDGRTTVSGQVPVMAVNGLLSKIIFDKNPTHEFYVEESFPMEWMYPHLTPYGFIMKINRERLAEISPEVVQRDRDFWNSRQKETIGLWLGQETSVVQVCEFVEKVFLRKDLVGFTGDPTFVRNNYATAAYSKLRSSQAGLYTWRMANPKSPEDQQRMLKEADFAFRQSYALCPTSPEAVFRYVNLLISVRRFDDALLIVQTTLKLKPIEPQDFRKQYKDLTAEIELLKNAQPK